MRQPVIMINSGNTVSDEIKYRSLFISLASCKFHPPRELKRERKYPYFLMVSLVSNDVTRMDARE